MTQAILIVVLVLLAVTAVVFALRARRARQPKDAEGHRVDPLADFPELYDPLKIGAGDIITYAGVDHVVRGTITLDEGGFVWFEHLLDGSTGRKWLTVEDDEGRVELTLWQRLEGSGLTPGGDVVHDGVTYRQIESGRANYRSEGTTGTPPHGVVDYADYASDDRARLVSFERWAQTQSWEVSTGRTVLQGELKVISAGPAT